MLSGANLTIDYVMISRIKVDFGSSEAYRELILFFFNILENTFFLERAAISKNKISCLFSRCFS